MLKSGVQKLGVGKPRRIAELILLRHHLCRWSNVPVFPPNRIAMSRSTYSSGISYSSKDSQQSDTWYMHITFISFLCVLPKTNSSPQKIGFPKRKGWVFQPSIFQVRPPRLRNLWSNKGHSGQHAGSQHSLRLTQPRDSFFNQASNPKEQRQQDSDMTWTMKSWLVYRDPYRGPKKTIHMCIYSI